MSDDINTAGKLEKPLHILHLEDVPADAELVQAALESHGISCEITWVKTRNEFENALRTNHYDLILSDYRLPDYDGLTALRFVKAHHDDTPFIFISGTMGEDAAIKSLTEGGTDYVLKHNLARLAPAIKRELAYAETSRERRQAEEALEESEEIFRMFMEYSPVYIFFKDENIRPIRLSRNFEKMLGRPLNEILGKNMDELFPSELSRRMVEDDKKVLSEGIRVEITEELEGRAYNTIKFPILRKGKPQLLAGFTVDITDRKLAEEAVQESEIRLSAIFKNIPTGLFIVNVKTRIIYDVNDSALETIGLPRGDVVGKVCHEFLCPAGMGSCPICDLGQMVDRSERELLKPDGTRVPILKTVVPITLKGENYFLESFIDITDRKQAELEIYKSEAKLRTYIEKAPVAVFVTDLKGQFIEINPAITSMLDYDAATLKKMSKKNIFSEKDHTAIQQALETLRQSGYTEGEFQLNRIDGTSIWVLLNISRIDDTLALGYCSNINVRKQAEEELRRQLNELQRWHAVTVDREDRMMELKKEVNDLLKEAGRPGKYGES